MLWRGCQHIEHMEPSPIATLLLLALPPDWQRGGGMVRGIVSDQLVHRSGGIKC